MCALVIFIAFIYLLNSDNKNAEQKCWNFDSQTGPGLGGGLGGIAPQNFSCDYTKLSS